MVEDARGLAMHDARRTIHLSAVDGPQTLMSQADTQDRNLAGKVTNGVVGDSAVVGVARAGRDDQVTGGSCDKLIERYLIVAKDLNIRPQLAEVLDEVVGERVVIINHSNHYLA